MWVFTLTCPCRPHTPVQTHTRPHNRAARGHVKQGHTQTPRVGPKPL